MQVLFHSLTKTEIVALIILRSGSWAKSLDKQITNAGKIQPFEFLYDESNERVEYKILVVLARLYDKNSNEINTRLIDISICIDIS